MKNSTSKDLNIHELRKLANEIRDLTEKEQRQWHHDYESNENDRRKASHSSEE